MSENERDNRIEAPIAETELAAEETAAAKRLTVGVLKRILATAKLRVMLVVILVAVASSVFLIVREAAAWGSTNDRNDSEGMGIETEAPAADAEYFVYVHDAKAGKVLYTGDDDDNFEDPTLFNLDMQFHDMIFKERNRYTPAIIRIELINIKPEFQNGGIVNVTFDRDTLVDTSNNNIDYFTTVMRFTLIQNGTWYPAAEANATANGTNVGEELYDIVDAVLYDIYKDPIAGDQSSNGMVYSTIFTDPSTGTKTESISISSSYSASDVVDGRLNIYLYITYDINLVNYYQAHSLGGKLSLIGNTTTMEDDIAAMSVSLGLTN